MIPILNYNFRPIAALGTQKKWVHYQAQYDPGYTRTDEADDCYHTRFRLIFYRTFMTGIRYTDL